LRVGRQAAGLKRLRKKTLSHVTNLKSIPQGLNRLRKKACFQVKSPRSIAQGLKPTLI